jgi:hypothetical protein
MIATAILAVGVSAMAALGAVMLTRGRQSKYISVAESLATEKLEDLNRYDMASQAICVQTGDTSEGLLTQSLASAVIANITCPGAASAQSVSYYDLVSIDFVSTSDCGNAGNGCFAETIYNGSTSQYQTTYHSPDGVIPGTSTGQPVSSSAAPSNSTYLRTWLVEANPPIGSGGQTITGTRRITVLVTLLDQSVKPPVTFQMSAVRQ